MTALLRDREQLTFAMFIFTSVLITGAIYQIQLWTPQADGFSSLSQRLPYWDFTNLWAGGRLAIEGKVSLLFDVDAYRGALRAWFGSGLPDQEWSYPPSILLIGAPLALLPLPLAYAVWTVGTAACLFAILQRLDLPGLITVALVLSPAEVMNTVFGQNGALTAALLIGTFLLLPTRPIAAGILAGILTIKPHLGLLIPICFLAAGQYRAIMAACATAAAMAAATALLWGAKVWTGFVYSTGPLMRTIMEADYPQLYHKNAMTGFIFARWIGLGVEGAYLLQLVLAAVCAAIAIWMWRPSSAIENRRRAVLTAVLALVATPYGYSYDAIPLCVAVAYLYFTDPPLPRWLLAALYLWPLFLHIFNGKGIGITILAPVILVVAAIVSERSGRPRDKTITSDPLKASSAKPSR